MREADQIRKLIIAPTLDELGMWSESAEVLLLGTCAQESMGFQFIKQLGAGGALSPFQIEPATYSDVVDRVVPVLQLSIPRAAVALRGMVPRRYAGWPPASHLLRDISFACAVARIKYWSVPQPLPAATDLAGMAAYWKEHYNTVRGAGQVKDWLSAWQRFCV